MNYRFMICERVKLFSFVNEFEANQIPQPQFTSRTPGVICIKNMTLKLDMKIIERVICLLNIQSSIQWFVTIIFEKRVLSSAYAIFYKFSFD